VTCILYATLGHEKNLTAQFAQAGFVEEFSRADPKAWVHRLLHSASESLAHICRQYHKSQVMSFG
jgi:hypothetical protein